MTIPETERFTDNIDILIGPDTRPQYLTQLLKMDGLVGLEENPRGAYCAVSLTNTPAAAKKFVAERQEVLKGILKTAGIDAYDPGTAPFSPDLDLTTGPEKIYWTDLSRIAGARYFTFFDTFPSTGVGVEIEAARRYNRTPVVFHDDAIRTSRMQPDCTIHVGIKDLEQQANRVTALFQLLQEYEPGRGLINRRPALLGFKNGEAVDLSAIVLQRFPDLSYTYDGTKPALQFGLLNGEVFPGTLRT
jgi:hypothetical protein